MRRKYRQKEKNRSLIGALSSTRNVSIFPFSPLFFLRNKKYSWRIVAARGHWLVTQSFGIPAGIGTDTKTRWAASLTGRQRIVHSAGESSSFLINFVSVALFLCRSDYLNLIWSNVRRNWGLCVIATGVSRSEYSKRWKWKTHLHILL